jgi:hypothetical protein
MKQDTYEEIAKELNDVINRNFPYIKEISIDFKRKLLLYINPVGGKGLALQRWNSVKKLFGNLKHMFNL